MGAAVVPIATIFGVGATAVSLSEQSRLRDKAEKQAEISAMLSEMQGRIGLMESTIQSNMLLGQSALERSETLMQAMQMEADTALSEVSLATDKRLAAIQADENRKAAIRQRLKFVVNGVDLSDSPLLIMQEQVYNAQVRNQALSNEITQEEMKVGFAKQNTEYLYGKADSVFALRQQQAKTLRLQGYGALLSGKWGAYGTRSTASNQSTLAGLGMLDTIVSGVTSIATLGARMSLGGAGATTTAKGTSAYDYFNIKGILG